MRNVTAELMGDPQSRESRAATDAERERTRFAESVPAQSSRAGKAVSELGERVRLLEVGASVDAPSRSIANGLAGQMATHYGRYISCRVVQLAGGVRVVRMTRVR